MNAIGRWGVMVMVMLMLMLVVGARAASAQTSLPLSLDEAIRRGVEQAPRMAEARAREAAAGATTTARRADGLPSAFATAGYLRTNHVPAFGFLQSPGSTLVLFPDIPDNYRVRAEMDVPLYSAGRVKSLTEVARADEAAAGADRGTVEQDVRLEVIRAYWLLVMARENVSVIERGLERTDAYVRDARSQVDAGVASPSDVLTAQAQRARQSVRVVQARNAAASAQLELARLIGAPPGQSIVTTTAVSAPMNGIAAVSEQSADALIARALQGRSERTSLTERRTGFQASAVAALANRKPWIGGALAVEPASPNSRYIPRSSDWNTSWELGVNLTWPLFDGGKAKANYAAATAQADGVEARIADFDAMVGSTEARRVLEERYRAGVATSTDVLDAQVSLLEAELERTNLAASLRLSEARLLRALGGL